MQKGVLFSMESSTFRPKLLHRARIQKQLDYILEVPLFLITASMGYGKTTTVKYFLKKQKTLTSIWFGLSTDETDKNWMWKKFCDVIKEQRPDISASLYESGLPETYKEAEYIVLNIRNKIKEPVVVIIDDYHENRSLEFDQLLIAFVKNSIPNFHIVLTSRTMPNLPIEEFKLKGLCKACSQNDLEFTLDEINALFELNGSSLNTEEQKLIYKNTEGWTSAIYLALLKYYETKIIDKDVNITILLKTAVFDKLDLQTQIVLLKLSVFDSFNLDAAIFVTENRNAGKLIYNLLVNNCFIRFDNKNKVYTIHSIFRELLLNLLKNTNIDKSILFTKYADWYMQKNRIIEAIELYTKAENYIKILDIFEIHGATELIDLAPKTIENAFEAIDISLKLSRPIAYITFIFSYLIVIDGEKGYKLLMETKEIYEHADTLQNKNEILGEIALVESFLYFNDIRLMSEHCKRAYELLHGKKSSIMCSEMMYSFGSPNILYLYHKEYGGLKALVEFKSSPGLNYYEYLSHGNGAGSNYIMQAEYYLETGDLKNAEYYAHKGIFKAKINEQISVVICGRLCLARAAILKGQANTAFYVINELEEEIKNVENHYLYNSMEIALGMIYGNMGMLSKIPSWLTTDDISSFKKIYSQRLGIACIVVGKSAILRKSYIELEVIVETIQEVCTKHNNIFGYIYAGIFSSIAKYNLYGLKEAMKEFTKTIKIAEVDKIISPFVESMPDILMLLQEFQNRDKNEKHCKWIKKVFALSHKFMEAYEHINRNNDIITFTKREEKVLSLLQNGYKQTEIAENLCISPNTVKRHVQNIYSKLGVNNKVSALKKIDEIKFKSFGE